MQAPQLLSAVRDAGLQDAAALHYLARMDEGRVGSVTRDTGPAGTAGHQREHSEHTSRPADNIPGRARESHQSRFAAQFILEITKPRLI